MLSSSTTLESLTCPVCGGDLSCGDVSPCRSCETPMHAECREFIGGCARFACEDAASPRGRLMLYLEAQLDSGIEVWKTRLSAMMCDRILPVIAMGAGVAGLLHTLPLVEWMILLMVLASLLSPIIDLLWLLSHGWRLRADRRRLLEGDLSRLTLLKMLQKALSDQDLEERSLRLITLWHSELIQVLSGAFVMGVTPGDKKKPPAPVAGEGARFLAPSGKLREAT